MVYRNPVRPGDFPDPSVLRVGSAFYAVTTSTDWAPYFPIFRSDDLVTWELVAHVFAERPVWCAGNFWAPDFAEKDGRFYVYYTARAKDGGLCVAVAVAQHPAGPYVDVGPLIDQRDGSIDAMACDDEHGARWLLWKEDGNAYGRPTPLWAQRLALGGTTLDGEPLELFRNDQPWEGRLVEAPHVIRRDGWFYMFYSGNKCCGEDCAYAVGVARARRLTGPWEKNPANPILAGNEHFRCPGHGAPVDDGRGGWFYVYHAYRAGDDAPAVGRQLMLDRITWGSDGWPSINEGQGPSHEAPHPRAGRFSPVARDRWQADFTRPLDALWQWPQSSRPSLGIERGHFVLRAEDGRRSPDALAAVAARPIATGDFVADASLDTRALDPTVLASLCVLGSKRDALGIGLVGGNVIVWRRRGGRFVEVERAPAPHGIVRLRVTALAGTAYRFAFARAGEGFRTLGARLDGAWLPPWDAGVRVALAAGGATGATARFKSFAIAPRVGTVTPIEPRLRRRERIRVALARAFAGRQRYGQPV